MTYPLVTHHGDEAARRGGRTYLALLLGSSTAAPAAGDRRRPGSSPARSTSPPAASSAGKVPAGGAAVLLALYAFGIGKAALMPLHRWLPGGDGGADAGLALLHAVAVVKAGVFAIVKVVVYVFGVERRRGAFALAVVGRGRSPCSPPRSSRCAPTI